MKNLFPKMGLGHIIAILLAVQKHKAYLDDNKTEKAQPSNHGVINVDELVSVSPQVISYSNMINLSFIFCCI